MIKTSKEKGFSLAQKLILILLFFASFNLMAKHFYFIFAAFAVSILFFKKNIVNGTMAVLLLFSISYIMFYDFFEPGIMGVLRRLGFPMSYIIGYNFILREPADGQDLNKVERSFVTPMVVIAGGTLLHFALNFFINRNNDVRNGEDFWTGEMMSATAHAMVALFGLGVCVALLFSSYKWTVKLLATGGICLIFLYNLVLAGRTILFMLAGLLLVGCFYKMKSGGFEKKFRVFFVIFLVVIFLIIAFQNNWFNLKDIILESNFSNRFDEMSFHEDNRWERRQAYLQRLGDHLWGGNVLHDQVGGYAHDMVLDVYSEAGIVPCIFLVIFLGLCIFQSIRLVFKSKAGYNVRLMVLCLNIAVTISFFLEPILQSTLWFFSLYCFVQGMIAKGNCYVERR